MNDEMLMAELKDDLGEASALLPCTNEELLTSYRFDRAFWALKDTGPVEEALLLIGHRRDRPAHKGWSVKAARARLDVQRGTEDAEVLARHGDYVYVLGSQSGGPDGVLDPERSFVLRFSERNVRAPLATSRLKLEIANRPFIVHRAVNDALRRSGLHLIALAPHAPNTFILPTIEEGYAARAAWAPRLQPEDYPVRVDGLVFLPDGSALLGLRFPMTADGHPLLVRIEDLSRCFAESGALKSSLVGWLAAAGGAEQPVGIRGLQRTGTGADDRQVIDVLTGPLGSPGHRDALAHDYPGSEAVACRHWRLELAAQRGGPEALDARLVRKFDEHDVEGFAQDGQGRWHYSISAGKQTSIAMAEPRV